MVRDEKAYCSTCAGFMEFDTVLSWEEKNIDGEKYRIPIRRAVCGQCGAEASYAHYTEEAGRTLNSAIKKRKGLVPSSMVRELADMMGGVYYAASEIGVSTFVYNQFIDGMAPSEEDSDRIRMKWEECRAHGACFD